MKNNFLGLGTAAIGRPTYINIKRSELENLPFDMDRLRNNGKSILDQAYQLGIRHYDTSPGYGIAEDLLMEWIMEKADHDIVVSTKWGYTYVANFDPNATVHEVKEHSLDRLNEQWEVSKNLRPYLKYYQIHSATLDTGVLDNQEILERLAELRLTHNIAIGLSTTGANQVDILEKALSITINGKSLFTVFQCTYNLLDQSIYDLGKRIEKEGKQLIVKEALANGRIFTNQAYPNYKSLYNYLDHLEKKHNTTRDAIILAYCHYQLPKASVLSGANNATHLKSNFKATELRLLADEIAELSKFRIQPVNYWRERKQLSWN